MKTVLVADIMTRNPYAIKPETDLLTCAKTMIKKRVGTLLLVEKKKLWGIISEKDILWALIKKSRKHLSKIRAIDISPRKIATISPLKTLDYAIKKIKKVKKSMLPVLHHGELVGLITLKDIFKYNPNLFPEMNEFHRIKEWDEKVKRIEKAKERQFTEGVCEECGNFDFLYDEDGLLICDSCKKK